MCKLRPITAVIAWSEFGRALGPRHRELSLDLRFHLGGQDLKWAPDALLESTVAGILQRHEEGALQQIDVPISDVDGSGPIGRQL
jgi:hypothetical protein